MHVLFVPLYDFFKTRKPLFWIVFLVSFFVWAGLASRIKLKEDISTMLPDSKAIRTMNEIVSNTQAGEQVVFLVSFADSNDRDYDKLTDAADDFTSGFADSFQNYIDTIILQPGAGYENVMADIVRNNLPLFLTEQDYVQIDSLLSPARIAATVAANKRILLSPAGVVYKRLVASDPVGISGIVWNKLRTLQYDDSYESYNGYLLHSTSGKLTFFLKPSNKAGATGVNSTFFGQADKYIEDWEAKNTGINITYFGGPAVAAGNATQMRTDTIVTLSVTIVLLLLLTYYFFRRKRTPLLLLVPVLYGGAMGLGILYLLQGSVSVIALGAGAIIMGIAIDFSIHFLAQLRNSNDIRSTIKELSQPLTLGSFTTIAAFLSLRFVSTPILQDLGLFAASSLLGAALCTLIFLPHFPFGKTESSSATIFDKIALWKPEANKWLVLFIFLLTPVMFYFSSGVQFDNNLMNLNYMSAKLKAAQDEVSEINAVALSSVFVVTQGASQSASLQKLEQLSGEIKFLQEKGWVRGVSNPTSLLVSKQEQLQRIQRWQQFWNEQRKKDVLKSVSEETRKASFSDKVVTGFEQTITRNYSVFDVETNKVLQSLFPGGFAKNNDQYYAIAALKVPSEHRSDVLSALENQDIGIVTDRQQGATQLVRILNNDFTDIAVYSSLIVFFALLIGYGRIELAIIAFLPMVISWVWILGLMSLLGLKFNIVNIIISSLIFGLGDDYAIFTMDGLVEKYRTGKQKLDSVRAAVYVSALTVVIGLGVLLLAKHPALRSIAFISVTGLVCVLFISQTLQPFLFNQLIQRRADKGYLPFTLRSLFISIFAFSYFFVGSFILTILGVIFTILWPFGKTKAKFWFHSCISALSRSLIYIMVNHRKCVYNWDTNDFKTPAVYIVNHASFLDILYTQMLNPRLILLTNRWVWRSPVFGFMVRMAEYYPVADGAESSIVPLRKLVDQGYSILVFPEGTRSYTGKMKRFHKGAFYIAEQLQLDIIPIVIHGAHYTMQKGDWLLKDGLTTINIEQRIKPENNSYGESYSERAKHIGRYMRKELQNMRDSIETPVYFKEQLIRSYVYKGPVLEWYCRIKTAMEQYYEPFHKLLPEYGKFYDLGCGYGFMTYMLHWSAPNRVFTGVDYDEEKIETAQGNFLRDEHIYFEQGDVTKYQLAACDGIIISDVLHYLLPEQQLDLLEKCYTALNEDGRIIIRDGISELTDRIKGTKLTETFSTKIFSFNKTQNELHFINRKMLDDFAARHNLSVTIIDNSKRTANLIFILQK